MEKDERVAIRAGTYVRALPGAQVTVVAPRDVRAWELARALGPLAERRCVGKEDEGGADAA